MKETIYECWRRHASTRNSRQWWNSTYPPCHLKSRTNFGVALEHRFYYFIVTSVDCVWNVMTRADTRFGLSAKRTSPFKSSGASVQSTTGSRGVRISGSNVGYTMFRGSVKGTGYPLHSPVSPSLPPRASPCAITFQLHSTTWLNHALKVTQWNLPATEL